MTITSPVFGNNQMIPSKYTCDGDDINPPLRFLDVPAKAKSLVMIMDDPDAPSGVWVHWILWNINPSLSGIEENSVPEGVAQGMNNFGKKPYGGPCPPSGTHRYFFKLYALNNILEIDPSSYKSALEKAMVGHVLETAELIGLYSRK